MSATLAPVFSALSDESRWEILELLGSSELSASALSTRLPISRQAIAKHLAILVEVGLIEPVRVGREIRFRAIGAELGEIARRLERIGTEWDRRLASIKEIAERI